MFIPRNNNFAANLLRASIFAAETTIFRFVVDVKRVVLMAFALINAFQIDGGSSYS